MLSLRLRLLWWDKTELYIYSQWCEFESMLHFNYNTHRFQCSSDTAKPGELIKQHYQGGAFFWVAKSSLLIPIPGFACSVCVCVWFSDKRLYCTIGHKTVWCPRVLSRPFSWKPSRSMFTVRRDQTSHLTSRPSRTWRCELEWVTWSRAKSLDREQSGDCSRCVDSGQP